MKQKTEKKTISETATVTVELSQKTVALAEEVIGLQRRLHAYKAQFGDEDEIMAPETVQDEIFQALEADKDGYLQIWENEQGRYQLNNIQLESMSYSVLKAFIYLSAKDKEFLPSMFGQRSAASDDERFLNSLLQSELLRNYLKAHVSDEKFCQVFEQVHKEIAARPIEPAALTLQRKVLYNGQQPMYMFVCPWCFNEEPLHPEGLVSESVITLDKNRETAGTECHDPETPFEHDCVRCGKKTLITPDFSSFRIEKAKSN